MHDASPPSDKSATPTSATPASPTPTSASFGRDDPAGRGPRVVVVGGGFGGLAAARELEHAFRRRHLPAPEIVLLDRHNHHLFQPLLYQVATAGLSPADIAMPIRSILSDDRNVTVLLEDVQGIDPTRRVVRGTSGEHAYDYLVLACGANHSYFGHDEWEEHAPGLKTLEQATEIRRRILLAFELAEREPAKQREHLTMLVVGGGPTGVELAGAVGEISRYTLAKDFRRIDPAATRIILIEAAGRILQSFAPELARRAARDLEQLGVQIWTNARVSEIGRGYVKVENETIRASTVLWAAGVAPSPLGKDVSAKRDRAGRVEIGRDLTVAEHPEIFVVGDMASLRDERGQPLPGLAQVAMQQGRCAARNIAARAAGAALEEFRYVDKGSMATIGRRRAVAQIGERKVTGQRAWLLWLLVHVYFLIGFKNKIAVMFNWMWSYLTFAKGARLIVDKEWRSAHDAPSAKPGASGAVEGGAKAEEGRAAAAPTGAEIRQGAAGEPRATPRPPLPTPSEALTPGSGAASTPGASETEAAHVRPRGPGLH
jgi:NADH dehydrogenase